MAAATKKSPAPHKSPPPPMKKKSPPPKKAAAPPPHTTIKPAAATSVLSAVSQRPDMQMMANFLQVRAHGCSAGDGDGPGRNGRRRRHGHTPDGNGHIRGTHLPPSPAPTPPPDLLQISGVTQTIQALTLSGVKITLFAPVGEPQPPPLAAAVCPHAAVRCPYPLLPSIRALCELTPHCPLLQTPPSPPHWPLCA